MKKAITILAVCSLLLTACGQIDDTESKVETTTTTVSESTTDTETSSAKEEKDTSEATTTTKKSSQTASSSSKPTGITVPQRNQVRQVLRETQFRDKTMLFRITTVRKIISLLRIVSRPIIRRPITIRAITVRNRITNHLTISLRLQRQSLR